VVFQIDEESMSLQDRIRTIPDFPIEGIQFRDITPLLSDPQALREAIDLLARTYSQERIECVVGIEARGFIFGAPLAYLLGAGFVPVRKPGKLPGETVCAEYTLEYGVNRLEMHRDAISAGQRTLIVDDLLATGGSALAAAELVERLGGIVAGMAFLVELGELGGRDRLNGYNVCSLITYEKGS